MTTPDQPEAMDRNNTQERERIQSAMDRLLRGEPLHSTGDLTVVQLAAEAEIKRWRLTHRHPDLMHAFQAATRQLQQESPLVTSWRERVEHLEAANSLLRTEVEELRATIQVYAEVIDDLNQAVDHLESKRPRLIRRVASTDTLPT